MLFFHPLTLQSYFLFASLSQFTHLPPFFNLSFSLRLLSLLPSHPVSFTFFSLPPCPSFSVFSSTSLFHPPSLPLCSSTFLPSLPIYHLPPFTYFPFLPSVLPFSSPSVLPPSGPSSLCDGYDIAATLRLGSSVQEEASGVAGFGRRGKRGIKIDGLLKCRGCSC